MSQNLQNFVKFQKFQLENLVDFEKCCKTHIFLQKSEPIQPKTSNILPKFCQPTLSDVSDVRPDDPAEKPAQPGRGRPAPRSWQRSSPRELRFSKCIFERWIFEKCMFEKWCSACSKNACSKNVRKMRLRKCIFREFCNFLAGSFSAVSKRNFARKYACDSILQALQGLHPFAPLQSQNFRKKSA